jgi:hypothetical protein
LKKHIPVSKEKSNDAKEQAPVIIYDRLKIIDYFLLASFFTFLSIITSFKIFLDDDTFWHLATGRFLIQNGYIPSTDVFGYITYGLKWIPFEWGWDVLTYLLYNIGGYYTLSIFRTIIILITFAFIIYLLWKNNVSLSLVIPFSVVIVFGVLGRFSIRPQIATYLFLIIILFLFFRIKYNYSGKKNILVILPVIFLIWANIHMGVLLGILIFALYIISAEADYFIINKKENTDERKKGNKYLLCSFVISIIALLINPHFIDTYLYTFAHPQMQMLEDINEWKSQFSSITISYYYVRIYIFFLITGVLLLYYSVKKKDLFPALLYIVTGIYSVQGMRFMSDYLIIIFIMWMLALNSLFERTKFNKFLNSLYTKIVIIVCLVFLIVKTYDNTLYKDYLGNYFRETGFGVNEKFFPKSMFDFIKKENIDKIGTKPFNSLKIGGYFIWEFPESKNFIDSRNLNDRIYSLYKNINLKEQGYEFLLDTLGIDYVMYSTPYMTINASEIKFGIISYLSLADVKWKLIYWDDRSFLFVRNIPKFNDLINKYAYYYITPYNFIFNRTYLDESYKNHKNFADVELNRKLTDDPKGIIINDMSSYLRRYH